MSQQELLKYVVAILEAAGIPYMLTGSTVSSLQGFPRTTHDIDIVVGLRPAAVPPLLAAFPRPKFYLEEEAIRDGIARGTMFNAIDSEGGDTIDFWPLKPDAFDQSSFRRRIQESALGISMYVSQPEDTILSKLRCAKMSGGSEKQIADCIGVYELNHTALDQDYLDQWADELRVRDLLDRVRKSARIT
jgi:hypothetical protein